MAGLCDFTLIGTNIGSFKPTAIKTAKEPLLTADEVIKQASTYLGVPYGWDCKGVTAPIEVHYEKLNADNCQYFDSGKLLPGAVVSSITKDNGKKSKHRQVMPSRQMCTN